MKYLKGFVLGLAIVVGVQFVSAAWTDPSATPPGNNTDTPLNVGNTLQQKLGSLAVNTNTTNPYAVGLTVFGHAQIVDGTQHAGYVLTSDANGVASWQPLPTAAAPAAPAQPSLYYGGMYGGSSSQYTNPLAGNTAGCPAGYTSTPMHGGTYIVNNNDLKVNNYYIYLCYTPSTGTVAKIAEFGGMYTAGYPNPYTGGQSCPTGFTAEQVAGGGPDAATYACYSTTLKTQTGSTFGGMYSSGGDRGNTYNNIPPTYYNNPLTGAQSCPAGFQKTVAYGYLEIDTCTQ